MWSHVVKKKFLTFLLGCLLAQPAFADFIHLNTDAGKFRVFSEEKNDRIYVDVLQVATAFGVKFTRKKNIFVLQLKDGKVAIDPLHSIYSYKKVTDKSWRDAKFESPLYYRRNRLMVPLAEISQLFQDSFNYHLQKRELRLSEDNSRDDNYKDIRAKITTHNQKLYISVYDVAKELGIVVYSSQANRYGLVLPDFSSIELRVGQTIVYKRKERFRSLEDPVILYNGYPYISLTSFHNVFDIDAKWDKSTRTLRIPAKYGHARTSAPEEIKQVTYLGYKREPLKFTIDEVSAYYQSVAPSDSASNDQIYDSVRDFVTNDVIDPGTHGFGKVNGALQVGLNGGLGGVPFISNIRLEKLANTSRVTNGVAQWGFPMLQVKGGRDYIYMAGLNNQFDLLDYAALSHSSDKYGDGDVDDEWHVRTFYGAQEFSTFISTSLFSQTVDFKQNMVGGGFGANVSLTPRQNLSFNLDHYYFTNRVVGTSAQFHDQDFFSDIFGDGNIISVDPSDQTALAKEVLTDKHMMSLLDTTYRLENVGQLQGTVGVSYFKENTLEKKTNVDNDWKVRAIIGHASRLDISYEDAGADYRSLGNPLRYQDRKILRIAPYLEIARFWKMYPEYRRERSEVLVRQGLPAYTNSNYSLANYFSFRTNAVSAYASEYDSTLYGKRWNTTLDFSHYFGRNSFDIGSGWASQWLSNHMLFSQSYTGRASIQIVGRNSKFSMGEEFTHIHYQFNQVNKQESRSNISLQVKKIKTSLDYEVKAKNFYDDPNLYSCYFRVGHQLPENKIFNLFFSITSLKSNLKDPELWRAGFEYLTDIF